ncbi:MAG: 1-deoxy-D-xylulose-5-phosphate reductoisomerase, partial [Chloroflexi bacterium]|nr:1-deoxy-D-xylulose-5-phosphate reductoisomerase [Chloroflexota bacterium]
MTAYQPLRLVILGATGSIGRQTLDVVRAHPDQVQVLGLAAARNAEVLGAQVREFHPAYYSLESGERAADFASLG